MTFAPAAGSTDYFGDPTAATRGYIAAQAGKTVFNGGTSASPVFYQASQVLVNDDAAPANTLWSYANAELDVNANAQVQCTQLIVSHFGADSSFLNSNPGSGTLVVNGGQITTSGYVLLGWSGSTTLTHSFNATVNLLNGGNITQTGGTTFGIGSNGPGTGTVTLTDSSINVTLPALPKWE